MLGVWSLICLGVGSERSRFLEGIRSKRWRGKKGVAKDSELEGCHGGNEWVVKELNVTLKLEDGRAERRVEGKGRAGGRDGRKVVEGDGSRRPRKFADFEPHKKFVDLRPHRKFVGLGGNKKLVDLGVN
ncbi:hypothetical protein SUGI_0809140 [Cryptomeria japonica]|nr:hypothetical protein SUGI_0809140 [Cryptomeria japonica]